MQIATKTTDLNCLVDFMNEKLKGTLTCSEKIQLLILTPAYRSNEKVSKTFGVSDYIVEEACALAKKKGIIALLNEKKGRTLLVDSILLFYEEGCASS